VLHDLTGDIEVATYRAYLVDHHFPVGSETALRMFYGYGTHPDASVALLRALTEAVQSRLGVIQGARDSYNVRPAPPRAEALADRLRALAATHAVPFGRTPSFVSDDAREDLRFLLDRLRRAGFEHCVVVDLTRPDLAVPVVRVRVAGLAQFHVNMQRIGARCLRWLL
jgi:ribosomal protein S12 methylthiotransferase accessory factor